MGEGSSRKKTKTVTLDAYDHLLQNPYDDSFSIYQLNEVIFLHGFKKIHKRSKSVLYDALSTIDLIKPQRSTLNDNLLPYDSSLISIDQVKHDLEALNWQECPAQSIETVGGQSESKSNSSSKDFFVSSFKINRKRRRSQMSRRRRWRIVNGDDGTSDIDVSGCADVDSVGAYDIGTGAAGAGEIQDYSSLFVDTYSWEF